MSNTISIKAVMAVMAISASSVLSLPAGQEYPGANANIPTVHPPVSSPPDQYALLALDTLNKMRTASGLQPLCITAKLQKASQEHSNWMSRTQIFEHSKFGFMENIAVHGEGYYLPGKTCFGNGAEKATDLKSSAEFTTNCQWKNSEGHYKNMMNPRHTRAGIAYAIGPFDGFKGYWWTQNFDSSDEPCIAGGVGSAPVAPPRNSQPPAQPTSTAVAPPRRSQPAAPSSSATRSAPAATTNAPKTTTVSKPAVTRDPVPTTVATTTTTARAPQPAPTTKPTTTTKVQAKPTHPAYVPRPPRSSQSYARTSTAAQSTGSAAPTAAPTAVTTHGGKHSGHDKCAPKHKKTKAPEYGY
ncbi:cysteine-rich secretory protein family-domain-containing protein [Catenaria anguillulae PL171]|uniref:Cysteine-rich secretory protein family-domain-containing protein n=1 Tax=Catenaria anguillulae PL171 TaxID=765915 RepID=A0A1Y2HTW4_9FUNG|nr:cysteine-rich secretory protein family-domain-containing protein [Catenaria anguillulae PL171]